LDTQKRKIMKVLIIYAHPDAIIKNFEMKIPRSNLQGIFNKISSLLFYAR
jgi:hypothetical protein